MKITVGLFNLRDFTNLNPTSPLLQEDVSVDIGFSAGWEFLSGDKTDLSVIICSVCSVAGYYGAVGRSVLTDDDIGACEGRKAIATR